MRNTTKTTKTNSLRKEGSIMFEKVEKTTYDIKRGNTEFIVSISSNMIDKVVNTLNKYDDIDNCHVIDIVRDLQVEYNKVNQLLIKHNMVIENNIPFDSFRIESEDGRIVTSDFTTNYDDAVWFLNHLKKHFITAKEEIETLIDEFFFKAYERQAYNG